MKRSNFLQGFALILCGLVAANSGSMLADDNARQVKHFGRCAKACADCLQECASCAHHCGHIVATGAEDQRKAHLMTAAICTDCADFCAAATNMVSRQGPLADILCASCARACDRCAARCEKFTSDQHMQRCSKSCRDCATACREMVKHLGHEHQETTR
jgi:hypothetical protein